MKKTSTRCLSALLAGGALALVAAPAHAATQRVVEPYECVEFPGEIVLCDASSLQYNAVHTPAGVWIYNGRFTYDYSITVPGSVVTGSTEQKVTKVFGRGANVSRDFTFDVSEENGVTCTFQRKFIFAGGSVRAGDSTSECS